VPEPPAPEEPAATTDYGQYAQAKQQYKKNYAYETGRSPTERIELSAFDLGMFEPTPPEGLYEVDIGMNGGQGDIMTFADVDSDKFTDIITVNGGEVELHLFDNYYKKFVHAHSIDVPGCSQIHNIVVGRSSSFLRLFVTCASGVVHFVDRESVSKEAGIEDFQWVVSGTDLTIDAGS
jgi:hypothetical protein